MLPPDPLVAPEVVGPRLPDPVDPDASPEPLLPIVGAVPVELTVPEVSPLPEPKLPEAFEPPEPPEPPDVLEPKPVPEVVPAPLPEEPMVEVVTALVVVEPEGPVEALPPSSVQTPPTQV